MTGAPLELVMIDFPGNKFRGDIIPALADLVERNIIDIIDCVFVRKDGDDQITIVELDDLDDLDDGDAGALGDLVDVPNQLVADEDVIELAAALAPNSSAGILLFEHTWAREFADAVRGASGEVRLSMRIPASVVDEVLNVRAEVG